MFGITRGFKYILPVVNSARIHIGYDELNRKANYTKNISPSIPIITFRPSIPSGQFSSIASPPTRQDPEEQSKSPNDILYHTHRLNLNDLDIELSRKGIIRHGRNKQMEIKEKLKGITCKKFWRGMQIWRSPSLEVICSKLERNIRYYIIYQTIYKIISREIKHLGNGLSKLKEDLIFTKEKTQAKWTNKFYVPTYSSETRIHKFKQDLLKFFPFATFLTVPMMELLLPLWLVIFPNSIPSHFQSERARKETIQHRIRHRRLAVQDFILHLLIFMSQLEHEKYIPLKDREEITGLKLSLEDGIIATGILQHKNIFSNYINLNTVPVPILTSLVQFLCLEPITGLGVINRIRLKLGKTAIPFDAVYVHWYMKPLLKKALKRYISRIRQRDKMLSLEGINFRTEEELKIICFKRGIETENKSRDQLSSDLRIWLNISNFSNVSNFLLIFTGILDFLADTNQQELRSTAEDFHLMDAEKYVYKRNLKLFEREMDINTIEKIVKKIEARKQKILDENLSEEHIAISEREIRDYTEVIRKFERYNRATADALAATILKGDSLASSIKHWLPLEKESEKQLQAMFIDLTEQVENKLSIDLLYSLNSKNDLIEEEIFSESSYMDTMSSPYQSYYKKYSQTF